MLRLAREGRKLEIGVHEIPPEQDQEIARLKLETMGVSIDTLTEEQRKYRDDYAAGT